MRVKFLKEVDVELNAIPNVAWGRIQKRHRASTAPTINPETNSFATVGAEMGHYFPSGAIVELPDQLAAKYLANGSAEVNVSPNGPRVPHDQREALN